MKKITSPSFFTGNEVMDVFLPIMGADCFAIYSYFKRIEFTNPKLTHSVRAIEEATKIDSTLVLRSLEILEQLGLIKLTRFGGSRGSECQLTDSKELAIRLGARYHRETVSFSLPQEVANRLTAQVKVLREKQQSKRPATTPRSAPYACGNPFLRVSQRNASISQEKRQRPSRETQMGTHLIQEEARTEKGPSPTPSQRGEIEGNAKTLPDEEKQDAVLKAAQDRFTGVMNHMADALLDSNMPNLRHLANGSGDWGEFGFNSLGVVACERHGDGLLLTLTADDPAALRGLDKYAKRWRALCRKWFGCEVEVTWEKDAARHAPVC